MGIKDNMFTFNGKSSFDFGIILSGYDTYTTPKRDVTMQSIAGRSGDLTLDNGRFENVGLTYKCLAYKDKLKGYEALRAYMASCKGYNRLEDTFHPDEFRLAVFKSAIEPKLKGNYEAASFKLEFDAKPQRYLKSGEETITLVDGGTIYNDTLFDAKPLIRAYSAGNLTVNGKTLTISSVSGYIDIDCDIMNAYKGSTNLNANIGGVFPVLSAGLNTIVYTGTLDIIPRWYTL